MTSGQFREVDLDLLADYVGGALDGTSDEAEVSRLVSQAPDWAAAYAALTGGLDAVQRDLAVLAEAPEPMPTAVLDRLVAALAQAAAEVPDGPTPDLPAQPTPNLSDRPTADVPRQPTPDVTDEPTMDVPGEPAVDVPGEPAVDVPGEPAVDVPGEPAVDVPGEPAADRDGERTPRRAGRQLSAVPVQARTSPSPANRGPGRRRRWTRRAAGPVLLAAVVVGFAGFAISRLVVPPGSEDTVAGAGYSTSGDGIEQAPLLGSGSPPTGSEPAADRVLTTGSNYTSTNLAGTVGDLARGPVAQTTPRAPETRRPTESDTAATSGVPAMPDSRSSAATTAEPVPGLERLADPTVLARCLDAVAAAHARGPVAVDLVDYAMFEGKAALVVVFTDSQGIRWAWATGPDCGTSPTDADVTYQTRVG